MRATVLILILLSLFYLAQSIPDETVVIETPDNSQTVVETKIKTEADNQESAENTSPVHDPQQTTTTATSQSGSNTEATQDQQGQQQVDQFGLTANERELFRKFELKKIEDKIALKLAKLRAKVEGKHHHHHHASPTVPQDQQQHHSFHHTKNQPHQHQADADPSTHTHIQSQDQQPTTGFYGSVQLNPEEQRLYEKFIAFENNKQLESKKQEEVAKLLKKEAKKQNVDLESTGKNKQKEKKQKNKEKGKGKGKGKN